MADGLELADADALSLADFTFKLGNDSNPDAWAAAPAPTATRFRRANFRTR